MVVELLTGGTEGRRMETREGGEREVQLDRESRLEGEKRER